MSKMGTARPSKDGRPPPRAQSLVIILLLSSTQQREGRLRRTVGLGNHRGAGLDEGIPASKLGRLRGHIDIHDTTYRRLKIRLRGGSQFGIIAQDVLIRAIFSPRFGNFLDLQKRIISGSTSSYRGSFSES